MSVVPDVDTLRLCSLMTTTAFGALFLFMWRGRRADNYLLYWAASSFLYGAVIFGFTFSGGRLWLVTTLLALLALSNVMPVMGLRSFEGRRVVEPWMALPMLAIAGCHLAPRLIAPHAHAPINGAMEAIGMAIAMGISGGQMANGTARGQKLAGGAMLAYLPTYAAGFWAQVHGLPTSNPLALMPMLADQALLGILNFGLIAIPFDRAQQRLREAALRDPLTGVFNRAGLDLHLPRLIGEGASLIAIDVDHFKRINDSFGHKAGDEVLVAIAREADGLARAQGGVLARLGGDEFVMVLPPGGGDPMATGETLKHHMRAFQDDELAWSLSMGIATLSAQDDFAAAMARADQALYRAKLGGRNRLAA